MKIRTVDNRNLADVCAYQEARIEALTKALKESIYDMEAWKQKALFAEWELRESRSREKAK